MSSRAFASLAFGILLAVACHASVVITQWDFNTYDGVATTGTLVPSVGSGTAATVGGTTSNFLQGDDSGGSSDPVVGPNDSAWNIKEFAPQGAESGLRGARFNVSTVGYENIAISWDHYFTQYSSYYGRLEYSLDGVNFTSAGLAGGGVFKAPKDYSWFNKGLSFDLSSIAGVANNPNFAFRLVSIFDPSNPTLGYRPVQSPGDYSKYDPKRSWRFDMVTVSGTEIQSVPVPEPATILLGIGALGAALRTRRRR